MDYKYNRDRIIRSLVREVLGHFPGGTAIIEDPYEQDEAMVGPTSDPEVIVDGLGQTDMERLVFFDKDGSFIGSFSLVHEWDGNPGEIISDYGTQMEPYMVETNAIAMSIMDRWDTQH